MPSHGMTLHKMNNSILSVDIGATKIAAGLVYPEGSLGYLKESPTNAKMGGESVITNVINICQTILNEMAQEKNDLFSSSDPVSIGVSTAGQVDVSKGNVIYATDNLPGWTGMEIKQRIESALRIETWVENDINCMAVGEANFGAGKGKEHILFIGVGTGIGGAIIIDGNLYRGWKGSAGEIGHISINDKGNLCNCGSRGCIETYSSGSAIEKIYKKEIPNIVKSTKNKENEVIEMTCKDITLLSQSGDEYASIIIKSAGKYLGICLSGLLNLLNPEIVILGGGVLINNNIYIDAVRKTVIENALEPMKDTPIIETELEGHTANLIGAAIVCRQQMEI